jgi:hypothetical protein
LFLGDVFLWLRLSPSLFSTWVVFVSVQFKSLHYRESMRCENIIACVSIFFWRKELSFLGVRTNDSTLFCVYRLPRRALNEEFS